MKRNKHIGPNGLTPKEAENLVPDNVAEHAGDLMAADLYGVPYADYMLALAEDEFDEREADDETA